MLEPLDFVVMDSLPQDTVTIFGKSRPNIVVYKSKGRFIKDGSTVAGAVIMDDTGMQECKDKGVTLELKRSVVHLKFRSAELAQCCGNMVIVSDYLTERVLQKGYLVKDINIYGLLVSHKILCSIKVQCPC